MQHQIAKQIILQPVEALIPYARNSRTHSNEQVTQIAASIREFGFTNPVLVDDEGGIVAGHGRVMAARQIGMTAVPTINVGWLSEQQRRAYVIADNQLAMNAGWDESVLAQEVAWLQDHQFNTDLLGFNADFLDGLLALDEEKKERLTNPDDTPELQEESVTRLGDVWVMGKHRLMCGDSTSAQDVARLMGGKKAALIHADPPYGMGKAADGVANDNLYRDKLDQFQMQWWRAFRPMAEDNASVYIWGNALELWRLWFSVGLGDSEKLELRNEIVWDKKNIAGMASPYLTQFPSATERCLFFQIGKQFIDNVNTDDFPETWEPVRSYLEGEAKDAGIRPADIKEACGVSMYSHWFTKSQFTLIPEKHYRALATKYAGYFSRPWKELKMEWDRVKDGPTSEVQGARSYFDNAHDIMRDVWEFPRVTGEDRHNHATPKPVAMMERVMRSSLPPGGLCAEPFGGSGSTLMGAETTGRICYAMELQEKYCDVIVRRWQAFTGKRAVLESTGQPFPDEAPAIAA